MMVHAAQPDLSHRVASRGWRDAALRLALAWAAIVAITFDEWRQMAHQWWNIDTYNHCLLILPIAAWLAWLKRTELAKTAPSTWLPGLAWAVVGFLVWFGGRQADVNLVAQAGVITAIQGAAITLLGLRASLLLGFPLFFLYFIVPFGDEIIPQLQFVTAKIAIALTHWSGVPAVIDRIYIDTPVGLFIVAEACSGVKFLVAMVALGTLIAYTAFESWKRRALLMLACVAVPILANGVRAWGTIYIAQFQGIEFAESFDHVVYGWFFFAFVIAIILGTAWRWFEREPEDAGFTAQQVEKVSAVGRWDRFDIGGQRALAALLLVAILFAAAELLV